MENGGEAFLKERYADFYTETNYSDYDVTLCISSEAKPQKIKAPEGASEEEKAKVKEENASMKIKLAEMAAEIGDKLSIILSEFIGAPIRKALVDVKEESKENYLIEIPYRKNEKYWIKKTDTGAIVYFSVHFTDPTDIALAKIMCNELKDSKKISSQAVTVNFYSKLEEDSEGLNDLKVDPKKASVGVVAFLITSAQVKKNLETCIYFLTTFRQYVEYHVRMVKCLIHSRMRKRIGKFEIVFEKALRTGVIKPAEHKTTIGGQQKSDKPEEEKVTELASKRKYDEEEYTIGGD